MSGTSFLGLLKAEEKDDRIDEPSGLEPSRNDRDWFVEDGVESSTQRSRGPNSAGAGAGAG